MARKCQVRLSKSSRENMKSYPAKVERSDFGTFFVYCYNGASRSYLYTSLGDPVEFASVQAAKKFIQSFK